MPIHEATYLQWEGAVLERPMTWFVIARTGVRLVWRRLLAILLFIAAIPVIFRGGQIYVVTRVDVGELPARLAGALQIDAGFFLNFMKDQIYILVPIICICGAGLIASDRKYKALPLYFARPVNFWDYVSGKFLILVFYGGLITIAPALLLFVLQILLTSETGFFNAYYLMPLSIIATGAVILVVHGGLMLAVSAFARGIRSAVVGYFALIFIPNLLARILSVFREVRWISINRNIEQVASTLFGRGNPYSYPVWVGGIILAGIVVLCLAVLRLRIKPTEVVK
ncbi:MAG: hypothetical protein JSV33_03720 [bacterium]|nr:MAG: hypothetical protein JSV33_03720 [bacterium]